MTTMWFQLRRCDKISDGIALATNWFHLPVNKFQMNLSSRNRFDGETMCQQHMLKAFPCKRRTHAHHLRRPHAHQQSKLRRIFALSFRNGHICSGHGLRRRRFVSVVSVRCQFWLASYRVQFDLYLSHVIWLAAYDCSIIVQYPQFGIFFSYFLTP